MDPWALRVHTQTACISIDLVVFCRAGACDPASLTTQMREIQFQQLLLVDKRLVYGHCK